MVKEVIVITGFAEALAAPEAVWSLVEAHFGVVGFTRKGRSTALKRSRHLSLHEITPPEVESMTAATELADLLDSISLENPKATLVVLPLDDTSLWLIEQMPPSDNWISAGPLKGTAELALNKSRQIALAAQSGLKIPQTCVASQQSDLDTELEIPFPMILRPARAITLRGGRLAKGSNHICMDHNELCSARSAWDEEGDLLVQPYLQGTGEGIFGFATEKGVIAWSGHRRVRMMNPHGSGSSACESRPISAPEQRSIDLFVKASGWRGLFMVECLRDHEGTLWFVEFNGRSWGSMALARRQGFEYPAWAVQQALDSLFVPSKIPECQQPLLCRNLGRELMHLLFVARGPKSKAVKNWPSLWHTLCNVLNFRDRQTFYNWSSADRRVFFADALGTISSQLFKRR